MIGKIISHYRIIKQLGSGGMGVVYKAEDTKLKRTVALKFLPPELTRDPEAKARFTREAQAASALEHNNICNIHEIDETEGGQLFIAMACYEGESLKEKIESGPLKIEDSIDIAMQIAQGLQRAHKKGIVHRDIKPSNIFITHDDVVKIIDFGLAKLTGRTVLTKEGTTFGTVNYMSPEQTRGEEIDHRTDIWSLGVILYEMTTGQSPFKGDYEQAVMYSIVNEEPEPITGLRTGVPMGLERIIDKLLAKSPDERYQHTDELLVDLKLIAEKLESDDMRTHKASVLPQKRKKVYLFGSIFAVSLLILVVLYFVLMTPSPQVEKKSIAVLPFVDMSPNKDQEYFCDGITEEIINVLTRAERLQVASRTSTFQFKGEGHNIQDIGKELNVQTVLEGSVQKSGNTLRISAQLINVADGYNLWSNKYDSEMEDIFTIQDTITLAIVDKLKLKLLADEKVRLVKHHTKNNEAYDLYLKGRYLWNRRHIVDLEKAITYFEQAIEADSLFAPAYVGMADVYNILGLWAFKRPKEAFTKSKAAAKKALALDNMLGEAHVSMGFIHMAYDWDWQSAEKEYQRAIELNPSYPMAFLWHALHLTVMERLDEAIKEANRGVKLDPLSPLVCMIAGAVFYYAGKNDQAIEKLQSAVELDAYFPLTYYWLGQVYKSTKMYEEATAQFRKALSITNNFNYALGSLGTMYALTKQKDEALRIIDRLNSFSEKGYGSFLARFVISRALGEENQSLQFLESAILEREPGLIFLKPSLYKGLRGDPRFIEWVKKMEHKL